MSRIWRSARVVFAATLLTTCGTDTAIGPGIPAQSSIDLAGLLRAGGAIPIPIDTVLVELRRVSDSSVAFSQQVDVARFQQQGRDLLLSIALALRTTPEQFYLYAEARGGGVVYYTVRSTVTAAAGQTTQSPSFTPTYVGPGSTADSVLLTIVPSSVAPGDSALATAVVYDNDAPVAGAPVGIVPADTVAVRTREVGVNSVWLVAPATGSGSMLVTASTPTGLSALGQFDWAASAPVSYVTVLPAAQSLAPAQTLQYSATPYDALNNILTGLPVTWNSSNTAAATVSPSGLVTAVAVGTSTITATIGGVPGTSLLTVATPGSGPGSVAAASATSQGVTVNQLVSAVPSVLVSDSSSQPLAGVAVTFAVTGGGGTITGGAATTNASGIATLGSWRAGTAAGANTVTATVTGLPPVTFTATGAPTAVLTIAQISGNAQTDSAGLTLPLPLIAEVRDSFANPVPGISAAWSATDGTVTPASTTSDGAGRVQGSWTLGFLQANPTATVIAAGAQTSFTATTLFGQPTILLSFAGIPGVGIGLTSRVYVDLNQAAPAGGLTVSLVSGNPAFFTVPASVTVAQGQTRDSVLVTGVSSGTAALTGSAAGYTNGTLTVDVQNRNVSVPPTLNVPYGQTASLPIQIPAPAPAGGVTFTVSSSDATRVPVLTPTVTIAAGSQTANATLSGLLPGPATITVSNPAYIDGVTAAATTASINIVQGSASLNASFGTSISFNFESNGTPTAAPAPGITVSLVPADPTCLVATTPVTIATGLVSGASTLTYGGSATLPCTTQLLAQAPNLQPDSISVTVNPVPGISVNPVTVGSDLQAGASFFLGAGNHGGVTVTLSSNDPGVLLAPNAATPGASSITIPVTNGTQSVGFYVEGSDTITAAHPATVTVSATGFTSGTATVTAVPSGIILAGLPGATTTLSGASVVYAYVGVPSGNSVNVQNRRAGAAPLVVTFTTPAGVGDLLKAATAAGTTQTALIQPQTYYSPFDTTSGGVAFRPLLAGTTTVSVSAPGYISQPNATQSVTVSQATISVNPVTVGSGLQTSSSFFLGAGNHDGISVTLTSADPAVLLAPNATTAGASSISIPVANGTQSVGYYVQGLEGLTQSVTSVVTVSAPGFSTGTATMTGVQAGITLNGLPGTTSTLSPSNAVYAYVGVPSGNGLSAVQNLRAGGPGALTVTFTSPAGVGELLKAGTAAGTTQTALIQPQTYYTPFDTTSGGVAFHPLLSGTTTVSVSAPGYITTTNATQSVTVSQPAISVNPVTVGSGLQTSNSFFLGAPNHGGVSVTLTSSNAAMLLSPNATTAGASQITVPVPNGTQSVGFYVQGLEGLTQSVTATVTVSASGFTDGTAAITVVQSGITVNGLPGTTTLLSPSNALYAYVGVPAGNGLSTVQNLRVGGPGNLTVTFTSPAGVGELLKAGTAAGATQTAQIVPGTYYTPFDTTSGGVAFHPLTVGTTTVSVSAPGFITTTSATQTTSVSVPAITLNPVTVGSGLQASNNFFLGGSEHGGVTVTLTSSNPVMLLSPNATTAGSNQITIPVANGTQSVGFYVQGLEGQTQGTTTTVTASAPGFTNGTASITVVQSGVQVVAVPATIASTASNVDIYAYVGLPSGNGVSVQNLRFGGPGNLTVSFNSTNAGAAALVTTAQPVGAATQTAQIVPGTYYTPFSVGTQGVGMDPVSPGAAVISVSISGYISTVNASQAVTVQ